MKIFEVFKKEPLLIINSSILIIISLVILQSIAREIFPVYYIYLFVSIVCFITFTKVDFDIYEGFSRYLYIGSVIFLILPLIIGGITRGVVRWIQLGPLTIQPSEIVRPFLLLFFASYFTRKQLNISHFIKGFVLFIIPLTLILVQPSLGVAVLTTIGFVGVLLSLDFNKKIILTALILFVMLMPFSWFLLADYQKARLIALVRPTEDPYGAGYNSIQTEISVGSGGLLGKGLGEGIQTQLNFLPEEKTDFIFSAISEELGLVGALIIILANFLILLRFVSVLQSTNSLVSRAFVSGVFLTYFSQVMIHVGMNLSIFPITGIPLPMVSVGGSSLMATMITLGMVVKAKGK